MATNEISNRQIVSWLQRCNEVFAENKQHLSELDAAIGDADHGANMTRGFEAVVKKLPEFADKDIGTILKSVAMVLISTVGGASGPLYGTFFLQAATILNGKAVATHDELSTAFGTGLKGLMSRGKAIVGDKTMVDVLVPAFAVLHPNGAADTIPAALERAIAAAKKASDATVGIAARKGRASYLGERSIGHQDPGSASSILLLEALAASFKTIE